MRLHTALQHIRAGHFRSMEPWDRGDVEGMAKFIVSKSAETIEFTFDYYHSDDMGDTLQTFVSFADDLWNNSIAPIPHNFFWVSWIEPVLDENVRMAAFCERVYSPSDGSVMGLSVHAMFENGSGSGFAFVNSVGHLVIGDHKNAIISHADSESASFLVLNAFATVKGLLGALATPQAIRREEPAPDKLNRQRAKKGKELIRPVVVIDIRAIRQAEQERRKSGTWTVRPHWRRGHVRRLQDGRVIPIPPSCVNMEGGQSLMKPEYLVRV